MDLVRKLREQKAWSQEQLAEVAGVSKRTVQRIEKGACEISPETAKDLARALDQPAGDFIRYSGLRARLREIAARGPQQAPSADELRILPARLRSLFEKYHAGVAGIAAELEALGPIREESEMLHHEAMTILDANAKAWSDIRAADDTSIRLRLCAEITFRLEVLKRNASLRDEVLRRLNAVSESLFATTKQGMQTAAELDRALDEYDVYA
jgi:transcriptional regulator with XRE-family HTH domain